MDFIRPYKEKARLGCLSLCLQFFNSLLLSLSLLGFSRKVRWKARKTNPDTREFINILSSPLPNDSVCHLEIKITFRLHCWLQIIGCVSWSSLDCSRCVMIGKKKGVWPVLWILPTPHTISALELDPQLSHLVANLVNCEDDHCKF